MPSYININYPFRDSGTGFFLDLNYDEDAAIKADFMHLILTQRGQRLYNPDFGTDLMKFIFEPQDSITLDAVKEEIVNAAKKYLPNLTITDLRVEQSTESEYAAVVNINYTITGRVFETSDFITINI